MSNRVTHFEIPAENPEETINFFSNVFGWKFEQFGSQEYWLAISGDEKTPGINGAIMKPVGKGQPVINTISVDDIDSVLAKVEASGGKVLKKKQNLVSVGWLAFVSDPAGNIHGVLQPLNS